MSATPSVPARTLADAAALHGPPDALALVFTVPGAPPQRISRGVFRARVVAAAAALAAHGVGAGDVVVVAGGQRLNNVAAFWGAVWLGAVPSMFAPLSDKLDRAVYLHSVTTLVALSGVRAVFADADLLPLLADGVLPCPVLPTDLLDAPVAEADAPPQHPPHPDAIALLQHSSGTTGLQKGVALSHRAVLSQLHAYAATLGLRADDAIASWLPLYHDMGLVAAFLLPLTLGVPLVLLSPFDWALRPGLLLRALHDERATLCWLPNFAYLHTARRTHPDDLHGLDLRHVRAFVNCSEPVRHAAHQTFVGALAHTGVHEGQLAASYAMAENTFAVTQTPLGAPPPLDWVDGHVLAAEGRAVPLPPDAPGAQPQVSCGRCIPGTDLVVLGADGQALPARHVGELAIRGDSLFTGYHRRPDLAPFRDGGWYATGDQGYVDERGHVVVLGRLKDLIIHAGKNVFPQDIEAVVNTVPGVHPGRAVAFGLYDDHDGTERVVVVAEVHPDADHPSVLRAIRQAVATRTPVTLGGLRLVTSGWLLKTSSGKLARAANRDKWLRER